MTPGGVCGNAVSAERALTSAPPRTSARMASARLSSAAHISAVVPVRRSTAFGLAPWRSSASTAVGAAGAGGQHERGLTVAQRRVGGATLAPLSKSSVEQLGVAAAGRQRQRRHAVAVGGVGPGARLQQRPDGRHVAGVGGPVQRRRAVGFRACSRRRGAAPPPPRPRAAGLTARDQRREVAGRGRTAGEQSRRRADECAPHDQNTSTVPSLSPKRSSDAPKRLATVSQRLPISVFSRSTT